MNPGRQDERIAIVNIVSGQNAAGEVVPSRSVAGYEWAERVKPQRGTRAPSDGAQSRIVAGVSFIIRWRADLAPGAKLTDFEIETEAGERLRINSASPYAGRRDRLFIETESINEGAR